MVKSCGGNLLVNNEFVNSMGGVVTTETDLVAYNFVDGKDKKKVCNINGLGNIVKNVKDVKNVGYPLETHKFELKPIQEMKHTITEYVIPENPIKIKERKEEAENKAMPDITVKEFIDKLSKRLFLIEREHRFKKIQSDLDTNLNQFKKLMKEMRQLNELNK